MRLGSHGSTRHSPDNPAGLAAYDCAREMRKETNDLRTALGGAQLSHLDITWLASADIFFIAPNPSPRNLSFVKL